MPGLFPLALLTCGSTQDCAPFRFSGSADGWTLSGSLDSTASGGAQSQREESALNMFKQMDLKGKTGRDDTQLKTVHQNTISTVREYSGQPGSIRQISTSGVDGRVVVWNL